MFTSGFFNSVNSDRKYNAEQMSAIFDGIIRDGIFDSVGDHFQVTPTEGNLGVSVGTGRAWLNSTWSYNDGAYPLELSAASPSLGRTDLICIKVDKSNSVRANSIIVIEGTPASSPVEPTVTDDETNEIYYHKLAAVTVPAGATEVTTANIKNYIGLSTGTPYVTGILDSTTVDELWSQWDGEFNAWWEDVKATLDTDTVTNILNKIDHLTPKEATMNLYGFTHIDPPTSSDYTYQAYSTDAILNQISSLLNKLEPCFDFSKYYWIKDAYAVTVTNGVKITSSNIKEQLAISSEIDYIEFGGTTNYYGQKCLFYADDYEVNYTGTSVTLKGNVKYITGSNVTTANIKPGGSYSLENKYWVLVNTTRKYNPTISNDTVVIPASYFVPDGRALWYSIGSNVNATPASTTNTNYNGKLYPYGATKMIINVKQESSIVSADEENAYTNGSGITYTKIDPKIISSMPSAKVQGISWTGTGSVLTTTNSRTFTFSFLPKIVILYWQTTPGINTGNSSWAASTPLNPVIIKWGYTTYITGMVSAALSYSGMSMYVKRYETSLTSNRVNLYDGFDYPGQSYTAVAIG